MYDGEARIEVILLGIPAVLLILINGIVYLAAVASFPTPLQVSGPVVFLGVVDIGLAILLGFVLLFYLLSDDSLRRGSLSALIVILGAFSLWLGGGFVVGFVLAIIAGVIGIVFAQSPLPPKTPEGLYSQPTTPVVSQTTPHSEALLPRSAGSMIVRYCPKCDARNSGDARICQNCGATLYGGT
ncbi:MAG: zinc ribbon domain-containing protein [Thermoplasmata archaeon]|nr:zinc ribbon domain-containing protein [Thermoplasmata archaeon]